MTYITEKSEFTGDDVPLLDTTTPVKGYDGTSIGPANEQAQVLANRTLWLKKGLESATGDIAALTDDVEGVKLAQNATDANVTQLTSDVGSLHTSYTELDAREKNDIESLTTGLGQATTDIATNKLNIKNNETAIKTVNDSTLRIEKALDTLDAREKSDIESLTIGLGQATSDIANNKLSIKNNEAAIKTVNDSALRLEQSLDNLDAREKSDVKSLTTGLSQATNDIATNKLGIKNNETHLKNLDSSTTQLKQSLDTLDKREAADYTSLSKDTAALTTNQKQLRTDVDTLTSEKQDKLKSGTNINSVMGISLLDVQENGDIGLSAAQDFAQVMSQHLSVSKGLSLDQSKDGQTLTLSIVKDENLGSDLNIRAMNGVRANQEIEFKTVQRPNYNLRAFAFKSSTTTKQANLKVNFTTDLTSNLVSPYKKNTNGGGTARIAFAPDGTDTVRWSSVNTLQIDLTYPDTHVAFSVDGKNWQTYYPAYDKWIDLGELKVDEDSAHQVIGEALTVKQYNALPGSVINNWLNRAENTPSLSLAFAAPVSSKGQNFIPNYMSVTFKAVASWILQSPYFVPVTITRDSIIFKPQNAGDYVFCFEFQK